MPAFCISSEKKAHTILENFLKGKGEYDYEKDQSNAGRFGAYDGVRRSDCMWKWCERQ